MSKFVIATANFENLCRICMIPTKNERLPIFKTPNIAGTGSLAEKIVTLASVQVKNFCSYPLDLLVIAC